MEAGPLHARSRQTGSRALGKAKKLMAVEDPLDQENDEAIEFNHCY